jgi:uncharacterized protein YeaO (DUF488 family)
MTAQVRVARVYDPPGEDRAARILVDRLWPRGLSKAKAALDEWCKQVAPSPELRQWYGHAPDRFDEFRRRYQAELTAGEQAEALAHLRELARERPLVLLTASKALEISDAAVLAGLVTRS